MAQTNLTPLLIEIRVDSIKKLDDRIEVLSYDRDKDYKQVLELVIELYRDVLMDIATVGCLDPRSLALAALEVEGLKPPDGRPRYF